MSRKNEVISGGMADWYPPGPVAQRFIDDIDSEVAYIMGPRGSGKSRACMMKAWAIMSHYQQPQRDGKRRSRGLVVRSTYKDLETTTVESWLELFPEALFGTFYRSSPFKHEIRVGDVEADVWFIAMDGKDDVGKLLSAERTWAYANEGRELSLSVINAMLKNVGRYPSVAAGGCAVPQLFIDSNAEAATHWAPIMRGAVPPPAGLTDDERASLARPAGWTFYTQPPAMVEIKDAGGKHVRFDLNPKAENLHNLPRRKDGRSIYYTWVGSDIQAARVDLCNVLEQMKAGTPVWSQFNADVHVAKQEIAPVAGLQIEIGLDFGLTPAAVFTQDVGGRRIVLREMVTPALRDGDEAVGAVQLAMKLRQFMARHFPGFSFVIHCDPAGEFRGAETGSRPADILRAQGLPCYATTTNDPHFRREAVTHELGRMVHGQPALLISPGCSYLIRAMAGEYKFQVRKVAGVEQPVAEAEKSHPWSDVSDALQYVVIGGGGGRQMMSGGVQKKGPVNTRRAANVLASSRSPIARPGR